MKTAHIEHPSFDLDFWLDLNNWLVVLAPLAMGLLICALASSALGYFGIQFLWRWHLMRQIKQRRARDREMGPMPRYTYKGTIRRQS